MSRDRKPQTPWEEYQHRGGFLHTFSSFAVVGFLLVAVALALP